MDNFTFYSLTSQIHENKGTLKVIYCEVFEINNVLSLNKGIQKIEIYSHIHYRAGLENHFYLYTYGEHIKRVYLLIPVNQCKGRGI